MNQYAIIVQLIKGSFGFFEAESPIFSPKETELRKKILRCSPNINYEQYAEEFARLYWIRNYWKSVYFFEYEYSLKPLLATQISENNSPTNVTVLGAGSAAETVAYMVWANEHTPLTSVALTLIDRSQKQLDLAKSIVKKITPLLNKATFHIEYQREEVGGWKPSLNSADTVILGHFLTENPHDIDMLLQKVRRALKGRGRIIIIERERDPVWKKSIGVLAQMGFSVYDTGIRNEKALQMAQQATNADTSMTPYYVKASLPEQKYYADLVLTYFRAWKFQSPELLNDIFAKDATYDEKPGIEKVIFGLKEIQEYWRQNPLLQNNINLRVHNIGYGDNIAVCAFEGDFDTPKQHITIRGAMNFSIDEYSQKITKLVEYFGTEKMPFATHFN